MITLMSLTEEERDEYAEIVAVIADYQKYINLHHLHCCKMEGDSWVFVPEMEERNKIFYEGWPERKKKIIARIKADKYFVRNGKIGDKKELRKKDAKYEDLTVYYSLQRKFFALQGILADIINSVCNKIHLNALLRKLHYLNASSRSCVLLRHKAALNEHSPTRIASDKHIYRLIAFINRSCKR